MQKVQKERAEARRYKWGILVYCDSVEKAEQALNILAEEGTGVHKLQQNPPPHDRGVSGCVTDKYGFTWVLSAQLD